MKTSFLPVLCTLAFLASLPSAFAASCTDRDYRGLKVESLPPPLAESVCQFKLLLKNRNDQESLKEFVALEENLIGIGPKDLSWDQPLVPVINDLINHALADNELNKLAQGAQKFYGESSRYRLEKEELDLLSMLSMLEIQHGGRH